MPRDVNGNASLNPGYFVSTGDTVLPSQHNPPLEDIVAMLTNSLDRQGTGGMRAPLNMNNYPLNNVAPGVLDTDAATVAQVSNVGAPIGSVMSFAGSVAPETWMFCFGQAISRTGNADLYAAIGTAYGAGDGATTFNVPDCRGRVLAGKDNMGGSAAGRVTTAGSGIDGVTLGAVGGVQSVAITEAQMPAHTHAGTTNTTGAHTHGISDDASRFFGGDSSYRSVGQGNRQSASAGDHSHTFTTDSKGGGEAHTNMPPAIVFNYIIKASV